jgi:hypothetical protein
LGDFAAATPGFTYVSARPGTFPDAETITITNRAKGRARTVEAMDGGFDPVALEAQAGNELELLVHYFDDSTSEHVMIVPASKRPSVVRTAPPKGATEISLSTTITVVFTEPVDGSTLTPESFQLQLEGEPVDGTVSLSMDGLWAEFTPADSLRALSRYSLVITTGVLDLEGDPLEEEVHTFFTTEVTTEVIELCAKQGVVEEINDIQEPWPEDYAGWEGPVINSTSPACGVQGFYAPRGTFTYTTAGPELDFEFHGEGFVPQTEIGVHAHMLVYYPDPWPGRGLVCLGGGLADPEGTLRIERVVNLGRDLSNAKIWIVRDDWVDCSGDEANDPFWENPDRVPRLTNDRNDDGRSDATETLLWCRPDCDYGGGNLAYDWLFETALINYRYVQPPY